MAQRTSYDPGTFCWVDLSTVDPGASVEFYRRVFGWTADRQEGTGYVIFQNDGAAVAGLMEITDEQRSRGVPPFWNTYVTVQDADATAARVAELGGSVHVEPFDIETTGRTAVVADPQGAVFMLWQPGDFAGAELVNAERAWAWNDLQTSDVEGAIAFYPELLGWEIAEVPGSGGQYFAISNGGRRIGGVMPAAAGTSRPYWAVYFGVHSAGAALEHVEAAGGERLAGPVDVPAGRFAVASDPLGAPFSVVESQFDD